MATDTPLMSGTEPVNVNKDAEETNPLLYAIDENPPLYLSILLGFQHYLTMFGATVGLPFVLSQLLCFANDANVISEVLSTIFFCSGLVTLLQSTLGVRLPIVQGGTYTFIAPTMAIMKIRKKCSEVNSIQATSGPVLNFTSTMSALAFNMTSTTPFNMTSTTSATVTSDGDDEWKIRMREIQGAIILSSLFQVVIGFSGVMGFILKYIGPLTIAPTIALVGLPLFKTAGYFAGAQWGIALLTIFFITLFSQVLRNVNLPLGRVKIPVFKLFPVLLSNFICWILSAILTAASVFEDGSRARTDFRTNVIKESSWFRVPYPGQWGRPTVSAPAVIGMLAGVIASMVESIGDYYACARLAGAPPPPQHALNRGLGCEGLGCLITGLWGTGNGTTSYSENIGAIGITRVGSVRVIQCGAVLMILLSIIGKFGALFVTVPDPVVGGIFIVMFGMITAVGLSSLQFIDMSSMRNLFVLGVSLFMGMVIPSWIESNPLQPEKESYIQIFQVLLSTNMAVGGLTGFLLDNVIPGTKQERGLIKWRNSFGANNQVNKVASVHVYDPPFLTENFKKSLFCKIVPFLPYYGDNGAEDVEENSAL